MPQCGSVRFIVPVHSPAIIFGRYAAFCSAEPCAMSAAIAPWVSPGYIAKAMLAEHRNSLTICVMSIGRPWPPNSGGAEMPIQPPSTICLKASLKPVGVVTLPSLLALAAFLVADAVERRQHLLAELGGLAENGLDDVGRCVGEAGQIGIAVDVEDVVQQELHVIDRRLVARHEFGSPGGESQTRM